MDGAEPAPLDLSEFLQLLPELGAAELLAISAAYQNTDRDVQEATREIAKKVARRRGVDRELAKLEGSIIQWATSDIPRAATFVGVRPDLVLEDVRVQAVPPLVDAATALLLDRELTEEQREVLLGPVSSALE